MLRNTGFFLLILLSCSTENSVQDDVIMELPISAFNGFGPFEPSFGMLSMDLKKNKSLWGDTNNEVTGIPENWHAPVLTQIWFDVDQLIFQNYKSGNITEEDFKDWEVDSEKRELSEEPIKCFTHIVVGHLPDGSIRYKIDSDNDLDLADEDEMIPFLIHAWPVTDSISRYSFPVSYEVMMSGAVIEAQAPFLIAQYDSSLIYSIARHAGTDYDGQKLRISFGFSDPTFSEEAVVGLYDPGSSVISGIVEKNEFLGINGTFFQNLGVDYDRQVLQLKKLPSDTVLFSTQVGFHARPFEASEFTTGDLIRLSDYRGRYLYLDFWGSWCKPCIDELPDLIDIYHQIDHTRVEFLGVASDRPEALRDILEKRNITWPQILSDKDQDIVYLYNITGYPTSFLINDEGRIVAKDLRAADLLDTLNYYLD